MPDLSTKFRLNIKENNYGSHSTLSGRAAAKELASSIAALPYDVYDREEAREVVDKNPLSFLKIDQSRDTVITGYGYVFPACI